MYERERSILGEVEGIADGTRRISCEGLDLEADADAGEDCVNGTVDVEQFAYAQLLRRGLRRLQSQVLQGFAGAQFSVDFLDRTAWQEKRWRAERDGKAKDSRAGKQAEMGAGALNLGYAVRGSE